MRRGIVVLVASTVVIMASTQPALADPDLQDADAQPSSSYSVDHAISIRASLGFDSRLGTVVKASTDRDAYPDLSWGVPLSAAEAAEIQRRITVADAVLPAVEHAKRDPTWAGWLIVGVVALVKGAAATAKSPFRPSTSERNVRSPTTPSPGAGH